MNTEYTYDTNEAITRNNEVKTELALQMVYNPQLGKIEKERALPVILTNLLWYMTQPALSNNRQIIVSQTSLVLRKKNHNPLRIVKW